MNITNEKNIRTDERLIFALDLPTHQQALALVDQLGDSVQFYKIGLELFMAGEYFALITELKKRKKKIFADLKFFDVPQTVRSAVRALADKGVAFTTVHGNEDILREAAKDKGCMKLLAVTVLTSLDEKDINDLGFLCKPEELVLSRAKRALMVGCDGVISSGLEAPKLRESLGDKFLIVSPGIRPVSNVDDQKRTVDVEEAFHNGADYIVVGRPIRDAQNPIEAAQSIQQRIQKIFS